MICDMGIKAKLDASQLKNKSTHLFWAGLLGFQDGGGSLKNIVDGP